MIQYFSDEETYVDESMSFVAAKIAANCLAYMNSCVNPILYAFLSENFRKGFWRLIPCVRGSGFVPLSKLDVERTTARFAARGAAATSGRTGVGRAVDGDNGHVDGLVITALNVGNHADGGQPETNDEILINVESAGI